MDSIDEKPTRRLKIARKKSPADEHPSPKRVRRRTRRRGTLPPFEYVNWMDDSWVEGNPSSPVHTWDAFIANIGEDNLRQFPVRKQTKNDCTVASTVTAYEVQNRQVFDKKFN